MIRLPLSSLEIPENDQIHRAGVLKIGHAFQDLNNRRTLWRLLHKALISYFTAHKLS